MKFFIDTANVDEIRKANDMGIIAGVTTNPSLIAKEGRDYAETLAEIATIVDGPISGEVKATTVDAETMVAEGEAIYARHCPPRAFPPTARWCSPPTRRCWLPAQALLTSARSWAVWTTLASPALN